MSKIFSQKAFIDYMRMTFDRLYIYFLKQSCCSLVLFRVNIKNDVIGQRHYKINEKSISMSRWCVDFIPSQVACFSTLWELYANYLGVARMYNRVTIIQHLFSSYFTIALNRLDQQSRFNSSYGYWSTLCHTYLETYDIMHISSLLCIFYLVIQLCLLQLWQSQCCQL